jgi:ketosteroid isomerase-like protein
VVANDEHTIQLVTATATMGDKSFTYRTAEILHMRDGKITERWAFSDDTDRINKFFGGM